MVSSCAIPRNLHPTPFHHAHCLQSLTLASPSSSLLFPCTSLRSFGRLIATPSVQLKKLRFRHPRRFPVVSATQSNIVRVLQTVWRVGNDGINAGSALVPDSVPRPIARISVALAALTVSLFLIKSFLSTAFFILATMGLAYFIFIALNKDKGPRSGGGSNTTTEDSLEEARRIMEKYK